MRLGLRLSLTAGAALGVAWFADPSLEADSTLPTMLAQYENDRYAVNGVEKTFHELHTFTRSTTKWVVGEAGTLIEVAIDEPAFDYSSGVREFLMEDAATNIALQSSAFTSAPWVVDGTATVADNTGVSPMGSANGATASFPNTGDAVRQPISVTSSTDERVFPLWLKGVAGETCRLVVDGTLSGGGYEANTKDITLTADWVRYNVVYSPTTSKNSLNIYLQRNTGQTATSVDLWNAQLEVGSKPTSDIPTTTAAVIRAADNCKIDGTRFSDFWNAPIGTVYMKQRITSSSGYPELLKASDGGVSNRIIYGGTPALGSQLTVDDGGVRQVQTSPAGTIVGALHKEMFAYELNNTNIAFDGVSSTNDTSCTIPTVTQLDIFKGAVNGGIREIRYYPVRVTDSELARITSPYTIPSYLADVWGDLALWADADTSVDDTITETVGAVSQIDDKSSRRNHPTQGTGSLQPATGIRLLNGLNVLDANVSSMDLPAGLYNVPNSSNVIFIVTENDFGGGSSTFYLAGNNGFGVSINPGSNRTQHRNHSSSGLNVGYTVGETDPAIIVQRRTGGDLYGGGIGGTYGSRTSGGQDLVQTVATLMSDTAGVLNFNGAFAEIVILDAAISDIAFNAIGNGLATKWGITWTDI